MRYLLLLVALLAALPVAPALAATDGVVTGQLVNGTANGASVAGVEVTLHTFLKDVEKDSRTATTDNEGKFEFRNLETGPDWSYQVTLNYQGADYEGEVFSLTAEETFKTVTMDVWDATASDATLRVGAAHILVEVSEGGTLSVWEFYSFVNEGDKTYVGSKVIRDDGAKETLRFPLPAKAADLEIQGGLRDCCIVMTQEGVSDTMGVMPGIKETMFTYVVPYSSGQYLLSRRLVYPTDSFSLLVKGASYQAQSAQLPRQETLDIEGQTYLHLAGDSLAAGTEVSATIAGLPRGSVLAQLRWVALGIGVLAVVALVVAYPRLRRKAAPAPVRVPARDRETLLQEIADLDDRFEAGLIPEAEYRRQRAEKKALLLRRSG